jgi:hypothetical protein
VGFGAGAAGAHGFAVDNGGALDALELEGLAVAVEDDVRYGFGEFGGVGDRAFGTAVAGEAKFGVDGVYDAVPGFVVLHITPLLVATSVSQAEGNFENLLAGEAGGAFDAVPDAVVNPAGLVLAVEVNGEALALDGGIVVGVFNDIIVEQGAGIPAGAGLSDFEGIRDAGAVEVERN